MLRHQKHTPGDFETKTCPQRTASQSYMFTLYLVKTSNNLFLQHTILYLPTPKDLSTPDRRKAELTYVTCYIPRWFTHTQSPIQVLTRQCRLTTLIKANTLTTTLCRQPLLLIQDAAYPAFFNAEHYSSVWILLSSSLRHKPHPGMNLISGQMRNDVAQRTVHTRHTDNNSVKLQTIFLFSKFILKKI